MSEQFPSLAEAMREMNLMGERIRAAAEQAMLGLARSLDKSEDRRLALAETASKARYRRRIRDERHAGLLHVKATAARVRRELGLPPE